MYDPSQQDPNSPGKVTKLELTDKDFPDDVVQTLEVQPYPGTLDETMIASLTAAQQADLQAAAAAAAAATGNTGKCLFNLFFYYLFYLLFIITVS